MLNVGLVGAALGACTALTLYHVYSLKQQFYPICIHLMKSPLSVAVLSASALYIMFLVAYAMRALLFGTLRLIEYEHIQEYGWLTVSESFLAMTIFRDEFDAKFVLIFSTVLFIKGFHWIARDRVDYMEQTPMIDKKFHVRMVFTVALLLLADLFGLYMCVADVIRHGPSMAILFGNEFALLLVSLASTIIRYILYWGDLERGNAWEHRSIFLFYWDFIVDFLKLVIYSAFFGIVMAYYGVPLHIIRDLYLTVRSFVVRVRDIIRYRQATANMNERYPEATAEELAAASDRTCIICREEMVSARKLPCGHLFHFRCLRSWLERQQACPTCRRSIIGDQSETAARAQRAREAAAAGEGQAEPPNLDALPRARAAHHHEGDDDDDWIDEEVFFNEREQESDHHSDSDHELADENDPLNPNLVMRREQPPRGGRIGDQGRVGGLRGAAEAPGPAIVFPQLNQQAYMTMPPTITNASMSQIPGTVIPSPFGTIPVILIPPEQVAPIAPIPRQNLPPQHRRPLGNNVEPRSSSLNRPHSSSDFSETDHSVPRRPHSTTPATDAASTLIDDSEEHRQPHKQNLYVLRTASSSGSLDPNAPIVLESIGVPGLGDSSSSLRRSHQYSRSPQVRHLAPDDSSFLPIMNPRSCSSAQGQLGTFINAQLRERGGSLRSSVQGQLQRELESLTQLQEEIASLTDRILAAQDKINSLEDVPDLEYNGKQQQLEESDPAWGKQKQ